MLLKLEILKATEFAPVLKVEVKFLNSDDDDFLVDRRKIGYSCRFEGSDIPFFVKEPTLEGMSCCRKL